MLTRYKQYSVGSYLRLRTRDKTCMAVRKCEWHKQGLVFLVKTERCMADTPSSPFQFQVWILMDTASANAVQRRRPQVCGRRKVASAGPRKDVSDQKLVGATGGSARPVLEPGCICEYVYIAYIRVVHGRTCVKAIVFVYGVSTLYVDYVTKGRRQREGTGMRPLVLNCL